MERRTWIVMMLLTVNREAPPTYPPDVLALRKGIITHLKVSRITFCGNFFYDLRHKIQYIHCHIAFLDHAY